MQKALDINPRFAKAHFYAGLISYELGSYDAGLQEIEQALGSSARASARKPASWQLSTTMPRTS